MSVRKRILGALFSGAIVALLPVAPAVAEAEAEAEANDAAAERSADRTVPLFTNSDLENLPGTDNASLPSLEIGTPTEGGGVFVLVGTPDEEAPAGESTDETQPAPFDPKVLHSMDQILADLRLDQEIALAERRVKEAEARLAAVERGYRAKGSAFATRPRETGVFVRGVTDEEDMFKVRLRTAVEAAADARAELNRLLELRASAGGPPPGES